MTYAIFEFFLHPVTFTRAQKMVRGYFHMILSGKPGDLFFSIVGGDELVLKQMSNNNFATTEQIFTIFSGNMRTMPG